MEKQNFAKSVCQSCGKVSMVTGWEKTDEPIQVNLPEEKCPECLMLDILSGTFVCPT